MKTVIVFGSQKGSTEKISYLIKNKLNDEADIFNVKSIDIDILNTYNNIFIGTPSYGDGELPRSWKKQVEALKKIDFTGKNVAFFGLGDQKWHKDTFINGLKFLYDIVKKNNGTIIGNNVSTNGYFFTESLSMENNNLIGLALDEANEANLSEERVSTWINSLEVDLT